MAGTKTTIKWVNDIYLNSKKICGILTEGSTSIEQGSLEYVIIGIGINRYHQEFSEDIRRIATTIEDETNQIISRNELIIAIINQIDAYLKNIDDSIKVKNISISSSNENGTVEFDFDKNGNNIFPVHFLSTLSPVPEHSKYLFFAQFIINTYYGRNVTSDIVL